MSKLRVFEAFLGRQRSMKVSEDRCSFSLGEWQQRHPSHNLLLNICRSNCEGLFYHLCFLFLHKALSSCVLPLSLLCRNVLVKMNSLATDIFVFAWKEQEQPLSSKVCKVLLYVSYVSYLKRINFDAYVFFCSFFSKSNLNISLHNRKTWL